jgi:hypothetical protein
MEQVVPLYLMQLRLRIADEVLGYQCRDAHYLGAHKSGKETTYHRPPYESVDRYVELREHAEEVQRHCGCVLQGH